MVSFLIKGHSAHLQSMVYYFWRPIVTLPRQIKHPQILPNLWSKSSDGQVPKHWKQYSDDDDDDDDDDD